MLGYVLTLTVNAWCSMFLERALVKQVKAFEVDEFCEKNISFELVVAIVVCTCSACFDETVVGKR